MTENTIYAWASDYASNSGEGNLARMYISYLKNTYNYKFIFNKKKKLNKYLSSYIGILYCWNYYLKNRKVAYINYIPFWNFLIFLFLPPGTIIGPITGGALFNKKNLFNYFTRKYLFHFFYKISEFLLNFRSTNLVFSTDLLKIYLSKKTIKKSNFNFVLKNFKFKKLEKKKNDFLIYYRKHQNKENQFPYDLIKRLIDLNFKICVIGDKLNIPLVKNYGIVSNKKVSKLQSISKYTIASNENPYSLFIIECLSNNMKILIDKKKKNKFKLFKCRIIEISLNNVKNLKKIKSKLNFN